MPVSEIQTGGNSFRKIRYAFRKIIFSPNKGGTTEVGFLLVFYRITFERLEFCPSPGYLARVPRVPSQGT